MTATVIQFGERILSLKENPCPFCGSDETGTIICSPSLFGPIKYFSCCVDCKARGPVKDYPDLAIEAWNSVKNRGSLCS